jgi:transposase-like protein
MSKDKNKPVGAKRAIASGAATGKRGRFSAPRKAQAVLRLLRGEDLELLSRELRVVASTLSLWREQFLAAGQSSLKGKTGKADERDEQISRLKKKVGELTMDNELLREKAQGLEENLPLAHRRSRR